MELNHHRTGHGEPLLLVHGIGSRWQMWEPVIPALSRDHDVIAVDLPGFAGSPMPPAGTPAGVNSLVSLLGDFLAGLGVRRPHVAGNSLGGLIALEMGARGMAQSVCALSPAGFATGPETMLTRASLWASVRGARRFAPMADRLMATAAGRRALLNLFVAHPERISGPDAAASLRALASAPWFDATLPTVGAFAAPDHMDAAVTIAWGAHDRVLYPRQARRAAHRLPHARVLMLPGCGHVCTYDDPEQVARVMRDAIAAA